MSLQTGRQAIETYFSANWTATPFGYDGQAFAPSADSVQLSIQDGQSLQGSIGRTSNVINNVGLLTVKIYVGGGKGSAPWRGYADDLTDLFHGITLDTTGALVTSAVQTAFIRFSPPELGQNCHPYIGAQMTQAPFLTVNFLAPFIRYETR